MIMGGRRAGILVTGEETDAKYMIPGMTVPIGEKGPISVSF